MVTVALCLVFLALVAHTVADRVLFDFESGFDVGAVEARDATVFLTHGETGSALRLDTGHREDWPGITVTAPAGHWDLSGHMGIALDIRNVGQNPVHVYCRVDNPGADGIRNCNTDSIALKPGESGTLTVTFARRGGELAVDLFGMRGYPLEVRQGDRTIDPANVTQLIIFVGKPTEDHSFEIDNIRATGVFAGPKPVVIRSEEFFPFIDTFGQYIHRDWPGKTHSLEEMAARREAEAAELAARPGPEDWDAYGGWAAGPQLEATGFFRVDKYQGKWWLVDPEGRLFFSHGIDCVDSFDVTPIEEREHWFQHFPGDQPEFAEFLTIGWCLHGHYAGRSPRCFNFHRANLKRKYGPEWHAQFADLAHRRLRSWGLNTIGNWSDLRICLQRRTPYVASVGVGAKKLEGSVGYWGKLPDVFDPDFADKLRQAMAGHVGGTAGDPWCIGYFIDNEISWGNETSLAVATLQSPPGQAAKAAFLADLQAKYPSIQDLNAQWATGYDSWQAFLESREVPDTDRAKRDLLAFNRRFAEEYFRQCREAVKAVAPHNLYLGCRFAWVNDQVAEIAARYCDVVSFNLYRRSVADFTYPGGVDAPVIIGEFHFGALDRGLFHTGLVPVGSQQERAEAYRSYVESALRHPQIVGCHWFQYMDEPTTGRVLDEENYQIGFVDVADTPYPETVEACREVGYRLYQVRFGS